MSLLPAQAHALALSLARRNSHQCNQLQLICPSPAILFLIFFSGKILTWQGCVCFSIIFFWELLPGRNASVGYVTDVGVDGVVEAGGGGGNADASL